MSGAVLVDSEAAVNRLTTLLNNPARRTPVVVVTIASGRSTPSIQVDDLVDQVGDVAPVYVVPSGRLSWAFSDRMPSQTQVYGGAGRVYPVGLEWVAHPRLSPLRFAFDDREAARATTLLVTDALSMAHAAGLFDQPATTAPSRRRATGRVKGIVADRAVVEVGRELATVVPEIAAAGVPIERLLTAGMTVSGWLDLETHRLDMRADRPDPAVALASYSVGDVVLTQVAAVEEARVDLLLLPDLRVTVDRGSVTSNDLDDLRSLVTMGETVVARIVGAGPDWRLSLLDIDDDEEAQPAVPVYPGGPPWLLPATFDDPFDVEPSLLPVEPPFVPAVDVEPSLVPVDGGVEPSLLPVEGGVEPSLLPVEGDVEPSLLAVEPEPRWTPSPLLLDRKRRTRPAPAAAPARQPTAPEPVRRPGRALTDLTLTVDALRARLSRRDEELVLLRSEVAEVKNARNALNAELRERERDVRRLEHELRQSRTNLLKARRQPAASRSASEPTFADPETGFRHAVLAAWARRIPVSDQPNKPLAAYTLGPRFLESLATVEGISVDKVVDVVVEVLTGLVRELAGREMHPLRDGQTGPALRREDGAHCWRVALQVNAPSARRLHYWALPGGGCELSRVVLHDDVEP